MGFGGDKRAGGELHSWWAPLPTAQEGRVQSLAHGSPHSTSGYFVLRGYLFPSYSHESCVLSITAS